MDTIEAIISRHSVRDFSAKPVAKEVIMKALETAGRSPSSSNGQPWEVFVTSGETMEKIRKIYWDRYKNKVEAAERPADPGRGRVQTPEILEREKVLRRERLAILGLNPDDPASNNIFTEWSARLFGAPVLVLICQDKNLTNTFDIGMYVQTLLIAAKGLGVDSLIAGRFLAHQQLLRQELGIPENLNIVTAVGLGYPNTENVINNYRSPRRPIQEVVRYKS